MSVDRSFLRRLRTIGLVEGTSTLLLFGVAMPLKYVAGKPLAVTVVGSLHGALFIALVAAFLIGRRRVPLTSRLTAAGIFGAVVPFGPFVVDRWLVELDAVGREPGPNRVGEGARRR